MIAGTLALLDDPADSPLEDFASGGFGTLDIEATQTYLDDATVQHGRVAATVEQSVEDIHVEGTDIEIERTPTLQQVATAWVADVTDGGFVLAERTYEADPPFPFDLFRARCGTAVDPAELDCGAFVRAQRDGDRDYDVWMAGRREGTPEGEPNNVAIHYGDEALSKDAIGVGFETTWNGTVVAGVLYASGYVALHQPQRWGPVQGARFVRSEVLPVASVPDPDETEQDTLGGDS